MGKNYRLAVAFTSYALAGTALALPVYAQSADVSLSAMPLTVEGTSLAIPVTGQNAFLGVSTATQPSYQNADVFASPSFAATLTDTFNVGTGPYTGVLARVISHSRGAGDTGTIDSVVIGGQTMTAMDAVTLSGWSAIERVFYLAGSSLTGSQSFTVTQSNGFSRLTVQMYSAANVMSFVTSANLALLSNTLSYPADTDATSIVVGMLTVNVAASAYATVSGDTSQRVNQAEGFYTSLICDCDGGASAAINSSILNAAGVTYSYLGPVVVASLLPVWVPDPGEVAQLTVANGLLANSYNSQCASYYSSYYFNKTNSTYAGPVKNPHWGDYGCTVFWGGGDANINDNTVTILEYGATQCEFKRVMDPTPWTGSTATDSTNRLNNSVADGLGTLDLQGPGYLTGNPLYGETVNMPVGLTQHNGKVGAPHNYAAPCILGPDHGGASNGSLISVLKAAVNHQYNAGCRSAHALDFVATTETSASRNWRRLTNTRADLGSDYPAPFLCEIVGPQKRVYMQALTGSYGVRWYDLDTNQYVTGTGSTFNYSRSSFDGGIMFYVPERELLICGYWRSATGNLELQWMDVSVTQPTLGGTVTFSGGTVLKVDSQWSGATWCPHSQRILIGWAGPSGSLRTRVYEVEIPSTLTDNWPIDYHDLTGGQQLPAQTTHNEFKRWQYDEKVHACVWYANADASATDVVYVYRPRNT